MPAQQQHTSYTGYTSATNGPISPGQCVVLNASGDYYNVSSSAARATAGRRSSGIAITGCAGTAQDRAFELQCVGEIDTAITSLGAGTASVIRVSTAGMLERAPSYSSSDDVVGFCDADGTAHVCFPLAGLGMALGAASAATPTNSVQASNADGSFRGAAHTSISTDGYIEHAADRTGGVANIGDQRFARSATAYAQSNLTGVEPKLLFQSRFLSTAGGRDLLKLWGNLDGNRYGHVIGWVRNAIEFRAGDITGGLYPVGLSLYTPGSFDSPAGAPLAVIVHPNFALAPDQALTGGTFVDVFNGGKGYFWIEDVATVRAGALRTSGFAFWSRASDHHPMVTVGATDYDLLAGGSANDTQQTIDISSGAATANLANGKIIKLTGSYSGTATLTVTPQPTADNISNRFTVRNRATGTGLVVTNGLSGKLESAMPSAFARLDGETTPDGVTGTVITGAGAISAVLV